MAKYNGKNVLTVVKTAVVLDTLPIGSKYYTAENQVPPSVTIGGRWEQTQRITTYQQNPHYIYEWTRTA